MMQLIATGIHVFMIEDLQQFAPDSIFGQRVDQQACLHAAQAQPGKLEAIDRYLAQRTEGDFLTRAD
ncbi:MAG: hypothetical protein RIA72_15065 [Sphingopyxis sp.]|jgi:hypothetical protein|uniref:hypothetical protein n=1 Tax=Sphingopyxis sp. TaxID=1908224 RepID=UPI0032EAC2A1